MPSNRDSDNTSFCPSCGQNFRTDRDVCPDDGTELLEAGVSSGTSPDPLVDCTFEDRFDIRELLGSGGMARVYRGIQLGIERDVAVKVLHSNLTEDDTFIKRFLREARVISGLSHPNVVNLIDFGREPTHEVLYLVMEMIEGLQLDDLLERGRLAPALATEIIAQICSALSEVHAADIIHRDLKPANLMLVPRRDGQFQVKLIDFGIADALQESADLTQAGTICGTPRYMAPEQVLTEEVDARADIYALGALLFEMLSGQPVFDAERDVAVALRHARDTAPSLASVVSPEQVPGPLVDLTDDMLLKHREDRPRSVLEVRDRMLDVQRTCNLDRVRLDPERPLTEVFQRWIHPVEGSELSRSSSGLTQSETGSRERMPDTADQGIDPAEVLDPEETSEHDLEERAESDISLETVVSTPDYGDVTSSGEPLVEVGTESEEAEGFADEETRISSMGGEGQNDTPLSSEVSPDGPSQDVLYGEGSGESDETPEQSQTSTADRTEAPTPTDERDAPTPQVSGSQGARDDEPDEEFEPGAATAIWNSGSHLPGRDEASQSSETSSSSRSNEPSEPTTSAVPDGDEPPAHASGASSPSRSEGASSSSTGEKRARADRRETPPSSHASTRSSPDRSSHDAPSSSSEHSASPSPSDRSNDLPPPPGDSNTASTSGARGSGSGRESEDEHGEKRPLAQPLAGRQEAPPAPRSEPSTSSERDPASSSAKRVDEGGVSAWALLFAAVSCLGAVAAFAVFQFDAASRLGLTGDESAASDPPSSTPPSATLDDSPPPGAGTPRTDAGSGDIGGRRPDASPSTTAEPSGGTHQNDEKPAASDEVNAPSDEADDPSDDSPSRPSSTSPSTPRREPPSAEPSHGGPREEPSPDEGDERKEELLAPFGKSKR